MITRFVAKAVFLSGKSCYIELIGSLVEHPFAKMYRPKCTQASTHESNIEFSRIHRYSRVSLVLSISELKISAFLPSFLNEHGHERGRDNGLDVVQLCDISDYVIWLKQ